MGAEDVTLFRGDEVVAVFVGTGGTITVVLFVSTEVFDSVILVV